MSVRDRAGDHVLGVTAALSAVSLALVFGAALQVLDPATIPRAPEGVLEAIPHLNAVVVAVAFVTVALGWRAVRRGRIRRHRALMGTSFALFAVFLALYLYRVALLGPTSFDGGGLLATTYYLVLAVHILLAIVCVPLVYYVLVLALTRPIDEIPLTDHPRIGRIAAGLWLLSFVLGDVVYGLLYLR